MKFYKTDELFIAAVGYTYGSYKNGESYRNFEGSGFGIFKKSQYSSYEYIDIFSKVKYKNFHSSMCSNGDIAVNNPTPLNLFIQKNYDIFKNSSYDLLTNLYKIIEKKLVSERDLKKILFALNNKGELEKQKKTKKTNIKIYTDLYKKKSFLSPCASRDQETKDLITLLASKENPILVGDHGVGKTTLVEEIIYKIRINNVPDFLKNQKIIELDIANLISCKEHAEEKLIELIAYCIKKNIILFIDDIDKLIDLKLDSIITESIKRKNLKVISTTTLEKYNKCFSDSNFTKLYIEEPNSEELNAIIRKRIFDQLTVNNKLMLTAWDDIVDLLIELTKITNRNINTNNKVENEKNANPYLVTQIIDRMFGHAIANNQKQLTIENVIYAINSCDIIIDKAKEKCINDIKKICSNENIKTEYKVMLRKKLI